MANLMHVQAPVETRPPEARPTIHRPEGEAADRGISEVPFLASAATGRGGTAAGLSKGAGRPLDPGTRAYFEMRFGAQLGGVRLHTGAEASASARALGAMAFTVGQEVAIPGEHFAPGSADGRSVLAHELAHTVQNASGAVGTSPLSSEGDASEREADQVSRVPESASPPRVSARPTARVQRKRLADAPAGDAQKLSVPSTRINLAGAPIAEYFKVMPSGSYSESVPAPTGVGVELEGIPAAHLTPMTSIAMYMANKVTYASPSTGNTMPLFGAGVTVEVHLALKKYGLADGEYRFSWTGSGSKGTIYVETVTGAPAAQNTPTSSAQAGQPAPTGTKLTVGSLNFELSTEWAEARLAHLNRALALIPENALKVVDGLKFSIGSGAAPANEDGHYDVDKHEVVMYGSTWQANDARYGDSPWPVHAIAHEIGHAIDQTALRNAWTKYSGGSYANDKALKAAEKELTGARAESGGRYVQKEAFEMESPLAGVDGDFRKAADKDGVKLPKGGATLTGGPTEYSNVGWEDVYAESFALYATDPELLKLTRPSVYAYFKQKYPRK